jgi:hypothetical protein
MLIKIKSLDRDTIVIATYTVPEPDPEDESRRGASTCTTAMVCPAASPPLFAPPLLTVAASSRAPNQSVPFTASKNSSTLCRSPLERALQHWTASRLPPHSAGFAASPSQPGLQRRGQPVLVPPHTRTHCRRMPRAGRACPCSCSWSTRPPSLRSSHVHATLTGARRQAPAHASPIGARRQAWRCARARGGGGAHGVAHPGGGEGGA